MKNYEIDKKYAVLSKLDSLGSQTKFYKDGYWYKYDTLGKEGLAEELTSVILSCSTISNYVTYEQCKINGQDGCRSKSFLSEDERILTYDQIYKNITGCLLIDDLYGYHTASERLNYIIEFMKENIGLDITRQLYENIAIDFITQNPDRHYKNLALILNENGEFRPAPLFDNGQGLRQNFMITPPHLTNEECEEKLFATTVSGSFSDAFSAISSIYTGEKLRIDYQKLNGLLECYSPSLAKNFLEYRMERCKKIFHNINMSMSAPISILTDRPDGESYKDSPNIMSQQKAASWKTETDSAKLYHAVLFSNGVINEGAGLSALRNIMGNPNVPADALVLTAMGKLDNQGKTMMTNADVCETWQHILKNPNCPPVLAADIAIETLLNKDLMQPVIFRITLAETYRVTRDNGFIDIACVIAGYLNEHMSEERTLTAIDNIMKGQGMQSLLHREEKVSPTAVSEKDLSSQLDGHDLDRNDDLIK